MERLTIPDCVRGELEGLYTCVPRDDATVDLYAGRAEAPSGYPQYICSDEGVSHLDEHAGYGAPDWQAGGLVENLMAFAFSCGRTGRRYRERALALGRAIRACAPEDRDAEYRRFLREEGLETLLTTDGVPREGRLAFCPRDGQTLMIYTRRSAAMTLFTAWGSYPRGEGLVGLAAALAPRIRCLEELEARYGLDLSPRQYEGILRQLRF